ncbi:hypothetical protein EBR57_04875 [bacterium]|nr:hypothetical protein [bacterium]
MVSEILNAPLHRNNGITSPIDRLPVTSNNVSRNALLAEGVTTQLEALSLDEQATPHTRERAGMALRELNPLAGLMPILLRKILMPGNFRI